VLIEMLADVEARHMAVQQGVGIGSVVAAVCSWHRNRSIVLSAIAAFFTWLYVIYFAITRRPDEYKAP
jgi:hypothetical protein